MTSDAPKPTFQQVLSVLVRLAHKEHDRKCPSLSDRRLTCNCEAGMHLARLSGASSSLLDMWERATGVTTEPVKPQKFAMNTGVPATAAGTQPEPAPEVVVPPAPMANGVPSPIVEPMVVPRGEKVAASPDEAAANVKAFLQDGNAPAPTPLPSAEPVEAAKPAKKKG